MFNEHEAVPLEQTAIPPIPRETQWQPLEGTWVEERRCGVERGRRRAGLRVRRLLEFWYNELFRAIGHVGRRPKHVCHPPFIVPSRYKKLVKVTYVTDV